MMGFGPPLFQFDVQPDGFRNGPHGARPGAKLANRIERRLRILGNG